MADDCKAKWEAAEATIASLRTALEAVIDDAVGANHDPLWIVRREFIEQARAALAEGTAVPDPPASVTATNDKGQR